MSDSTSTSQSFGGGFLGLLAIVFIILKLLKVITWSWWWVLLPLWGPIALFFAILIFWFVFSMLSAFLKK